MEGGEQGGGGRGAKRAEEESRDGGGETQGPAKGRFRPGLGLQLDMESRRTSVLHRVVSFAPDPLPARQYDIKTSEPISFYLSGLEELLAWKPTSDDAFNVSTEPLAKRQPPLGNHRPRTLVCHDMMGGYLEDSVKQDRCLQWFIQGAAVRDPYVFYHWHYIDLFIYFSHHTVTIPPVVWTNAAHRNGVLMLGTFITEWTDGGKMCEAFLAGEDEEAYQAVAAQLAAIAQFYRFDGWLVNIENSLSVSAARNVPHFLRYLTAQVHRLVPGGQVLWYDSVLPSGELRWQNELNESNKVYFDACDGLFTNYNWKEEHLLRSREVADDRRTDVYVGVDVFARGDVVSGGFETNKSLRMIREQGLSVAIFAPGWVYEQLGSADFLNNEDKFWALLSQLLPIHSVGSLPFCTSFNLGMGQRHFSNGQESRAEPWYNLSAQEIQPLYLHRTEPHGGWLRTRCCLQDAWCGGSSLLLEGTIPPQATHVTVSCFELELQNGFLDDLSVTVSRHQAGQEEAPFACRLGRIWVLDAATLHSLSPVDAATLKWPMDVAHVRWHRPSEGAQLSLSLTLRWTFPPSKALCFRVHYRGGSCAAGPELPLRLVGEAHAPTYRVTELMVPAPDAESSCRLEFLVEPVPGDGVAVDMELWGKLVFVYSAPKLPNAGTSA
ncbi:Cytosolic endo-beta-N-acetylglucosaminidase [Varanus komodoensis]|nr:Cytosolic endo-beta-N-acetylglucosaminidase [Varanus komodoensis]